MLLRLAPLVLLACQPAAPLPTCAAPAPGDVVIMSDDDAGTLADVSDGAKVPMFRAPQGGFIMLIGARLMSDKACMLDATAALRAPSTSLVIGLDMRPLELAARGDGWLVPADPQGLSSMPNVAVCPTAATPNVDGVPARLELTLADNAGATVAQLAAMVTPTCSDSDCHAECSSSP